MGKPVNKYPISCEVMLCLEGVSGLLTKTETTYGGASAMIESDGWDWSRTEDAIGLISDLARHMKRIEGEMHEHVIGRP